MLEIYTESLLEAQQRVGKKAEVGDVIVRKRRLIFAPEMIGQVIINLPSKIGIYAATGPEIEEQLKELKDVYGEELAATGAVWGPPTAFRGNGSSYEPALTVYNDITREQKDQIRDIVGFEITLFPLHAPSPQNK